MNSNLYHYVMLDAEKLFEYEKNPQNFMHFYCEILQRQQEKGISVCDIRL